MDRIFEQTLLYDFYGELLTAHQQSVYEDAVYNDMSLSEIAQEKGISRQGVHDLIKRCDKILQDYESKLHLVERFMGAREKIREIESLTRLSEALQAADTVTYEQLSPNMDNTNSDDATDSGQDIILRMQRIRELSQELIKEW